MTFDKILADLESGHISAEQAKELLKAEYLKTIRSIQESKVCADRIFEGQIPAILHAGKMGFNGAADMACDRIRNYLLDEWDLLESYEGYPDEKLIVKI